MLVDSNIHSTNALEEIESESMPTNPYYLLLKEFGLPIVYLLITITALWVVYQDGKIERDKFLILVERQTEATNKLNESVKTIGHNQEKVIERLERNSR